MTQSYFLRLSDTTNNHLRTVLVLPESAGVTLRLSKSELFQTEVNYLGHVIKSGALEIT